MKKILKILRPCSWLIFSFRVFEQVLQQRNLACRIFIVNIDFNINSPYIVPAHQTSKFENRFNIGPHDQDYNIKTNGPCNQLWNLILRKIKKN